MNLFSVGQAYNTVVPDVTIIEDMGLPSIDTNLGTQTIGIIGDAAWGGESVYKSSSQLDLVRLFGGRDKDLGKMIDASRAEGRFNFAAMRVLGAGSAGAEVEIAAGADTTWTFTWDIDGAKGNDTLLQIIAGDIANTITLIFKLDGDYIRLKNVDNDEDSENFIGDKFNINGMSFEKTGTATTLPSVTVTDEEFSSGADGAAAADADLLLAAQDMLNATEVTHFMFAKRSSAALIAGIEVLAGEFPNVIFFQTPEEEELVDELDAIITEAKSFTAPNVVTCVGSVYYFNADTNEMEELEQIGFITKAAQYGYAGSPIGKDSRYRWVESWEAADREEMSTVHLSYARSDGRGWYINDLRTGIRDEYKSSIMVRSTFNTVEKVIAATLRTAIGMSGSIADRRARMNATLRSLGDFFVSRGVLEEYDVDVSKITAESVARGELLADFYVGKNMESRYVIITVKRLSDGSVNFAEEVR